MEKVAYDNIVRKLDGQRADLSALRNQASISAAITGLIGTLFATLLGPEAANELVVGNEFLGFSLVGVFLIVSIFGSVVCSALVLIGLDDFTFSFSSTAMLNLKNKHGNDNLVFEELVSDGEWYFMDNEAKIGNAQSLLWWSMMMGTSQIVPWILLLIGSANE